MKSVMSATVRDAVGPLARGLDKAVWRLPWELAYSFLPMENFHFSLLLQMIISPKVLK